MYTEHLILKLKMYSVHKTILPYIMFFFFCLKCLWAHIFIICSEKSIIIKNYAQITIKLTKVQVKSSEVNICVQYIGVHCT